MWRATSSPLSNAFLNRMVYLYTAAKILGGLVVSWPPCPPFRWPCVAMHCCLLWMGLFASSLWHSNMHIFWFIWSRLTLEFSCFKKRRAVPWNILNQTWNVYNRSRLQRSDIRKVNSQRIDRRNQMVYKFLNNSAFIFHCTVFYPWFF